MRIAIALFSLLMLQGQTTNPAIESQKWFAERIHVSAPQAPTETPNGALGRTYPLSPQQPGPGSHLLTVCASDQLLISWYRSFSATGLSASEREFVQAQINTVASDMTIRRC
jgi:hypothetical protein